MSFLMTPLADANPPNTPEGRYQAAHIKTRNSVERAFGVWKRRFPCLDMGLQNRPERSAVIITACGALHNLAVLRKDPEPPAVALPVIQQPRPSVQPQQLHVPPQPSANTVNGSHVRVGLIASPSSTPISGHRWHIIGENWREYRPFIGI
ncbi:uncharacterized protein LOC144121199 [Amblyomma americanum]